MEIIKKSFLQLLVLFLGFSFVLSIAAVPTSRSLKSIKANPALQDLQAQGMGEGEMLEVEGLIIEGRITIESADYPGTGANNHHDPITPGRV